MVIKFIDFNKKLDKHFSAEPHLVTECLIRYWFIDIHKTCVKTIKDIKIEKPYRDLSINPKYKSYLKSEKASADLYFGNPEDAVFEFKYHRQTENSRNCTATKMGSVFRDFNRLSILDNKEKYLIYVFDKQMKDYYENNSPLDIFKMSKTKIGCKYQVNAATDKIITFKSIRDIAFSGFNPTAITGFKDFDYTIEVVYKANLVNDYNLLIFKVI